MTTHTPNQIPRPMANAASAAPCNCDVMANLLCERHDIGAAFELLADAAEAHAQHLHNEERENIARAIEAARTTCSTYMRNHWNAMTKRQAAAEGGDQ